MRKLLYIGSPQFDGIGMLNTEAQKMQRDGELTILDGIVPGAYPEIRNFGRADHLVWTWLRRSQFLGTLNSQGLTYVRATELLPNMPPEDHEVVRRILDESIHDHCVCNNITEADAENYRQRHWDAQYAFLCKAYAGLTILFRQRLFSQAVVFNGRNTLAKVLVAVAHEHGVPVAWLEYFGKRNDKMTYISSPVDIFDFDAMSDFILDAYRANPDPQKKRYAQECLSDRVTRGDPMLAKWGVDFSESSVENRADERKTVAFFFSSEDEYPAVKPSVYGFNPPNEQYHAFLRICEKIVAAGLHRRYRFLVKLHPRYAVEKAKLDHAQTQWDQALADSRTLGMEFELVPPLTSAYRIIKEADLVFSYGSTAWEATYLGKPAVLMGPNLFATHDCAYIAGSVEDVIGYLEHIPAAKAMENCYPYAWAWRELGHDAQEYKVSRRGLPARVVNVLFNRFSPLGFHVE